MHVLALVAALLQPAPLPSPVPVPEEAARSFTRILQRTPVFAPGMRRSIVAPLRAVSPPATPFPVYIVEVPWTGQGGSGGTAVALFIDIPGFAVANRMPVPALLKELKGAEGSWGLAELAEDRTLAAWIEEKDAMRRKANEATALADLRTVASIEAVLESLGGSYAELECVTAPASCFASWTGGPLEPLAVTGEKAGYRRTFHPGARVPVPGRAPSRLLKSWAMTATPLSPQTGRRAFCIDSTGRTCATADGMMGDVAGGACPASCPPLP